MKNVAMVLAMVSLFGFGSYFEHNYTRENCLVIEASETGALFEDEFGDTWYVDCEGYKIGDRADLKINDACTVNTLDDDEVRGLKRR